jgi:seryl-tRNA synthetase
MTTRDEQRERREELNKMQAARQQGSQVIGEFIEWLNEQNATICYYDEHEEAYEPVGEPVNEMLARFFNIDLNEVEAERQRLLDDIRAVHAWED